jgi:hypothetical protein
MQAEVAQAFRDVRVDYPLPVKQAELYLSEEFANYAVPMIFDIARRRGNDTVDAVPRHSSASHAGVWTALLNAIERFPQFTHAYFDVARATDPLAERLLAFEHHQLFIDHVITSFDQGLWRVVQDDDGLRIQIAEPMRRSALHLIAEKAWNVLAAEDLRNALQDPESPDAFVYLSGIDDLRVFYESCPDAWAQLTAGLPFSMESLPGFRVFLVRLGRGDFGRFWWDRDELVDRWQQFVEDSPDAPEIDAQELEALIDFHSLTVAEAKQWGIQTPLLQVGAKYAAWLFAFHVLFPELNFLVILVRRYEALWSRTLGANLDRAADWIAGQLPQVDRLLVATRRQRKNVGEADLILFDQETGHLVVFEVKTTFDKFRTHLQLSNFTTQRVNFPKALGQAAGAAEAIRDGRWPLSDVFGKRVRAPITHVISGVLTWWDTFNPTLGTTEEVLGCNFLTLIYLVGEAQGDLAAATTTIQELSHLYCPGTLTPDFVPTDSEGTTIQFRREVQSDVLPDQREISRMSPLTQRVLEGFPTWDMRDPDYEPEFAEFEY